MLTPTQIQEATATVAELRDRESSRSGNGPNAGRMALFFCDAMPSMSGSMVEVVHDWLGSYNPWSGDYYRYTVCGKDGVRFSAEEGEVFFYEEDGLTQLNNLPPAANESSTEAVGRR